MAITNIMPVVKKKKWEYQEVIVSGQWGKEWEIATRYSYREPIKDVSISGGDIKVIIRRPILNINERIAK